MSEKLLLTNRPSLDLGTIPNQPKYCECAKVLSRPLWGGSEPLLNRLSKSSASLARWNIKPTHEHIVWGQSKDNIGLRAANGQIGLFASVEPELFSESLDAKNYEGYDSECFDGQIMREAVSYLGRPKDYKLFGFNCQSYVDKIKSIYKDLWLKYPANSKSCVADST